MDPESDHMRKRQYSLRRDIGFGMLLYQLSLGIDSENPVQRNAHLLIGIHILKSHIKQSARLLNKNYQPNDEKVHAFVHVHVQPSHRRSVAESSIERLRVGEEQLLYV